MESISLCGGLPVFSFCIAVSVPLLKKSRFFCANSLYFLVIFIMRHSDAADSRPLLPAYLVYRRQACAVSLLNTCPLLARQKRSRATALLAASPYILLTNRQIIIIFKGTKTIYDIRSSNEFCL